MTPDDAASMDLPEEPIERVRTIVEQHQRKERNHTYLLMALMIFELGQREFVDGEAYNPQDDNPSLV